MALLIVILVAAAYVIWEFGLLTVLWNGLVSCFNAVSSGISQFAGWLASYLPAAGEAAATTAVGLPDSTINAGAALVAFDQFSG